MTQESERRHLLRQKIGIDVGRGKCLHSDGKKIEGNVFRCVKCKKIVGFLRLPKRSY